MSTSEVKKCVDDEKRKEPRKFLMLFIVGFFTILVGIAILIIAAAVCGEGSANFGGVIFIWFIPIVFGVGSEPQLMVLFAVILAILGVIMLLIMCNKMKEV